MNRRTVSCLRSPHGIPVSCEIFAERGDDGLPVIISSVEVEGGHGVRIFSQTLTDGQEALSIYRKWRARPENRSRVVRIQEDSSLREKIKRFQRYE